jgi:hypothetical protein
MVTASATCSPLQRNDFFQPETIITKKNAPGAANRYLPHHHTNEYTTVQTTFPNHEQLCAVLAGTHKTASVSDLDCALNTTMSFHFCKAAQMRS